LRAGDVAGVNVSEAQDRGQAALQALPDLPGGRQLLAAAQRREDVELVGGAVRDLLLGRTPRELDVSVDGTAETFAEEIVAIFDDRFAEHGVRAAVQSHERFGTAVVRLHGARIDVATRRAESYAFPGALPDVRAGTPEEDLQRRDFTVNAIAVSLGGARRGELRAAAHALEDLAASRLRVLHDASFTDDPTRLLRLARYRARLRFEPDERTARLAAEAVAAGALATVSQARIGAELRLALVEPDAVGALESLQRLGVLSALHEAIELDAPLARAALAVLPAEAGVWPDVLLLASLLLPAHSYDTTNYETRLRALLDGYEIPAAERERTVHSAILAPRIAERLQRARTPSQVYEVAHDAPLEAVALAAALAQAQGRGEAAGAALRWLSQLRHVRLAIDGDDLLGAGVTAGPEIGRRLRLALSRKLNGELGEGREAELSAALEDV
jgi:tRNA nucleotidyltransferase (CCA-adding enzyme)